MHQVNLDDQLYADVQRHATDVGFSSVDEFVAELVRNELDDATEDFSKFFAPERLAAIDQAVAQADAGEVVSSADVREHFLRKLSDER